MAVYFLAFQIVTYIRIWCKIVYSSEKVLHYIHCFIGVMNPVTNELVPFNVALESGLINEKKGVYVNLETGEQIPITEALNKGLIVGQMMSHIETELLKSSYKAEDESANIKTVFDPISSLAVPVSRATQMGLVNKERDAYYNPAINKRVSIREAMEKGWINPTPEDLENLPAFAVEGRKPLQEDISGRSFRARIDWTKGTVRDSLTGKEISIQEALERGLIDDQTAEILSQCSESRPFRGLDDGQSMLDMDEILGRRRVSKVERTEGKDDENDTVTFTIQTTQLIGPDLKAITVEEEIMDTTLTLAEESTGIFSLSSAVKLGLYNVHSGHFRDPLTGETMPMYQAIERGFLDENAVAVCDIRTGKVFNIREAQELGLISPHSGRIDLQRVKDMALTLDPLFVSRSGKPSPVNFEDAILSGMYDIETGMLINVQL